MKFFYLLLLLNAPRAFIIAQTPIVLGNSNMPGANDTLRYTNVQPASVTNYTQTGSNFNWDFTNVISSTEGVREFKAASQTPYFLFFLAQGEYGEKIADTLVGGTGTLSITKVYNFYRKQTNPVNAFVADGMGMTISGLPVPSYFSDKDELYHFPMSFPQNDSSTFKFSTSTSGLIPIKYSKQGYRITTVDGWGTIKTPYGTDNCLRLVTTQYSKDTTTITIPAIPPFPSLPPVKIGIQNNIRSYQWMTTSSKIPYFEITGNLIGNNFQITSVRYRGYKIQGPPGPTGISTLAAPTELTFYPNPVEDKLFISGSVSPSVPYEIYDLNGKQVLSARPESSEGSIYLDVKTLPRGLYFVKVFEQKTPEYRKFVKMEW